MAPPVSRSTEPDAAPEGPFTLRPGDTLEGKWRLERRIGHGAMGNVWLAHDLGLDRKVAVKLLAEQLRRDAESLARFDREARLTARLEHPNIVPVYAIGQHHGTPFIVMKYLEGASLANRLRARPGPLPVPEVLSLARQLCAGLDLIHGQGLVHRDLKPSNVFLSATGHATILDFGILRESRGHGLTGPGIVLGTAGYMSPEQTLGQPADARSDLYSVGVMLFELLTGAPPFAAESREALRKMHVSAPVPDPRERAPGLPAAAAQVLVRALAKNPADRFQSAPELWRALEAAFPLAIASAPRRGGWRGAVPVVAVAAAVAVALAGAQVASSRRRDASPSVEQLPAAAAVVPQPPPPTPSSEPPRAAPPEPAPREPPRPTAQRQERPAPARVVGIGTVRVVTVIGEQPTWAQLTVDDKPRGGTPLSIELPEGAHRLRLERPGYRAVERAVKVVRGQSTTVVVELTP